MGKTKISGTEKVLIGFIIVLSILDLATNSLSVLPYIGSFMETLSEAIIEIIQIIVAVFLAASSANGKKKK